MTDIPAFLTDAFARFTTKEREDLRVAYETARSLYGDTRAPTGETRIEAVTEVARLLLPFRPDAKTLIATFLQHADAKDNLVHMTKRFGREVCNIISSLSILEKGCDTGTGCSPEKLRRAVFTLSGDIRVLLICLHNRWHELRRASSLPDEQRHALARQALNVFAPICARLGIYSVKYELETIGFLILHPRESAEVEEQFAKLRQQIGPLIQESIRTLQRLLREGNKRVEIFGREKHAASIFRKMRDKTLNDIRDIYDLFGIRILVGTIEDCYRVLGVIHRDFRPIIHRIKDYIAMPKPNGYRSFHTTVLGLSRRETAVPVEIQIRTFEMEEEAEYGIAAHWNYKEGGTIQPIASRAWQERMKMLQQLPDSPGRYEEFNDTLREEFSDRIFVLTPKGDPIELPKGATPLDFAFSIHTDIGLSLRSAKVNDAIAPIDRPLENGDVVEILKWKEPRPSEKWIALVHTKDARHKLRAFFRTSATGQGAAPPGRAMNMSRRSVRQ